ncbi:MAG TPA: phage/plasmid primase, P4 family, partial [Stellaceae bacterium]|nr:phage/plasmid primase, P4 family [Stellaceae bacterium]
GHIAKGIPHDGKLNPKSNVPKENLGKVPGRFDRFTNTWFGLGKWAERLRHFTDDDYRIQDRWPGANVCLMTEQFPCIDCDFDFAGCEPILDEIEKLITDELAKIGLMPVVRCREGVARRAFGFRIREGETAPNTKHTKWQIADGRKGGIDFQGKNASSEGGAHYVINGVHTKGAPYYLRGPKERIDVHNLRADDFPTVSREWYDGLVVKLRQLLANHGMAVVRGKNDDEKPRRKSSAHVDRDGSTTYPLGDEQLVVPEEYESRLIEALQKMTGNNTLDYDEGWRLACAIVGAVGKPFDPSHTVYGAALDFFASHPDPGDQRKWGEDKLRDVSRIGRTSLGWRYVFRVAIELTKELTEAERFTLSTAEESDFTAVDISAAGGVVVTARKVAKRFVAEHGARIKFIAGQWHVWNGSRWKQDTTQTVIEMIRDYCERQRVAPTRVATIDGNAFHQDVAKQVSSHPAVSTDPDLMDPPQPLGPWVSQYVPHPGILNTPDGEIDLGTGKLMQHDPTHNCTKITKVGPKRGPMPLFDQFMDEVTSGDKKQQFYLQKWFGYTITTLTSEQQFPFLFGPGGTGKSTLLELVAELLGDYAVHLNQNALVAKRYEEHPTEIMRLKGARMAVGSEVQKNSAWNEARVKDWTGGARLTGRFMGENYVEFQPHFKIWAFGNHKPTMDADGRQGMGRRLRVVPFKNTSIGKNPNVHLKEALKEEGPQILQWIIDGCILWQDFGLNAPESVLAETAEYFDEQVDAVEHWIMRHYTDRTGLFEGRAAVPEQLVKFVHSAPNSEVPVDAKREFGPSDAWRLLRDKIGAIKLEARPRKADGSLWDRAYLWDGKPEEFETTRKDGALKRELEAQDHRLTAIRFEPFFR